MLEKTIVSVQHLTDPDMNKELQQRVSASCYDELLKTYNESVETIKSAFPRNEQLYQAHGNLKQLWDKHGMKTEFLSLDDVLQSTREVSADAMKRLNAAMTRIFDSSEYPEATQQHALATWEYLATQVDQYPMISTTISLISAMENLLVMVPARQKESCSYFTMVSRSAYCVFESMETLSTISSDATEIIKDARFDKLASDLSRCVQKLTAVTKKNGPAMTKAFTDAYGRLCTDGQQCYERIGAARVAKNKDDTLIRALQRQWIIH